MEKVTVTLVHSKVCDVLAFFDIRTEDTSKRGFQKQTTNQQHSCCNALPESIEINILTKPNVNSFTSGLVNLFICSVAYIVS